MRRVITGTKNGKAVFLVDGAPANAVDYAGWPGHSTSVIWTTAACPSLPIGPGDEPGVSVRVLPGPGETCLMAVRFPPDTVFESPIFDAQQYQREAGLHLSGLIDSFEPGGSGFHRTPTIDYDVVLEGEIWLELDDGAETRLTRGDIVIQGGVRHAWRNRSNSDATMLFVLIGARRHDEDRAFDTDGA